MSIVVRHFERGDLGKIETRQPGIGIDKDAFYYDGIEELGRTMLEDGEPIAAWGMQPHWDGVASVWSEFSEHALAEYPLAVAKNVKRHLNEHIQKLGLHRVQSMIFDKDDVSKHWIEWLGFSPEGCLRQYVKGHDVWMYARLE